MRVLKTKTFSRWARKNGIADSRLLLAVDEMQRGLVDADLGGGLLKKLAGLYLGRRENDIVQLIGDGELQEVEDGKSAAS